MKNKFQAIWADIREAIAGTDKDFTAIRMRKAIFLLAVPMVLETAMESLFSIADIFFVSRLGSDPVAVVGITES
jgi:Na+-driven multidrug efflux pump